MKKIQNFSSVSLKLCLLRRDMGCEYHYSDSNLVYNHLICPHLPPKGLTDHYDLTDVN